MPGKVMHCYFCGGGLVERYITRVQKHDGWEYQIDNVPTLACVGCGETYYTGQSHDFVIDVIEGLMQADE